MSRVAYLISRAHTKLMQLKSRFRQNKSEWTGKVEHRKKKKFLAVAEPCVAIFWPTPGFNGTLSRLKMRRKADLQYLYECNTSLTTEQLIKHDKFWSALFVSSVQNLHHHYRAYGGWTFAFKDYYELNFTKELDNPNTQKMADIIDPICEFLSVRPTEFIHQSDNKCGPVCLARHCTVVLCGPLNAPL